MLEVKRAPTFVESSFLSSGSNGPFDILEDRDGTCTLVLCLYSGNTQAIFYGTDDAISAASSLPLVFYNTLTITKATRYMTLNAIGPSTVYWYVL